MKARVRGRGIGWLSFPAGGFLLALALPGAGWWPLVLLVPALVLEGVSTPRRWWQAAALGWCAGTVHWMTSGYWVYGVLEGHGGFSPPAAFGGLVVMGLVLGVTWVPVVLLTAAAAPKMRLIVFPAAWMIGECLRGFPPYLFPWNTTASSLSGLPWALSSLSIWGASGVGWAVITVGTALWGLGRPETRKWAGWTGACGAVLWIALSLAAPRPVPAGDPVSVVALQPGTTLEERWNPDTWPETARRVWSLSTEAGLGRPDVILWPESAMPYRFDLDAVYQRQVEKLAAETGAAVVLNSVAETTGDGVANAAFAVTPGGAVSRYDKIRLVPFGEYVPWWGHPFMSDSLVRTIGAFEPGREARVLDVGVPLGAAVCYEIVFPRVVARSVDAGAQVVASLTNDGWYGDSWALEQHFAQGVLRAVETRRWVVRAALTGISGAVDPTGRVVARMEAGETGWFDVEVQPMAGRTPAVRWGDWWTVLCGLIVVVGLAVDRRVRTASGRSPDPVESPSRS